MPKDEHNQTGEFCPTCKRCHTSGISNEQIESIAENAAKKAVILMRDNLARGVGFKVINALALMIGISIISIFFYLASLGIVKH
jgi:hypothetical protein